MIIMNIFKLLKMLKKNDINGFIEMKDSSIASFTRNNIINILSL